MQTKSHVLRTRVLTAVTLAPIFLAAIFILPPIGFSALIALLFLMGGWEFSRLCSLQHPLSRLVYFIAILLIMTAGLWSVHRSEQILQSPGVLLVLLFITAVWLLGFLRLSGRGMRQSGLIWKIAAIAQSLTVVSGAWLALTWIRYQPAGSWLIILLLFLIWAADIGAYFTGKSIGKRKLAPHISPGKTWAGVGGAIVSGPLVAGVFVLVSPVEVLRPALFALVAVLTVLISIGGDLSISLYKRLAGVKDSGRLFPGHGGLLDRFDSLISAAPFFALGLGWV